MTPPGSAAPAGPAPAEPSRGFWALYKKSLKPEIVEEPIDLYLHRPLAYVIARLSLPTPISPNLITLISFGFTFCAAWAFFNDFPGHLRWVGIFVCTATLFDCADGQLSRMRGTSSNFGRMLDGACDLTGLVVAVLGTTWVLFHRYQDPSWLKWVIIAAIAVTSVTTSFHTTMYDHYKNVLLKMTVPGHADSEGYDSALSRYRARAAEGRSIIGEIVWPIYLFYVKSTEDYVRGFDPYTAPSLSLLPQYNPDSAAVYRKHAEPVMRVFRNWFGSGLLVFGIAVAAFFDVLEWYMLTRLVLLNVAFYGYVRPAQRRASRAAFEELGLSFAKAPKAPL